MSISSSNGLEQGREVFAVPGIALSRRSRGTHRLIKQGAKLVEDADDILEEIRPLIRHSLETPPAQIKSRGEKPEGPRSPEETILLRILDKVPKHIDEIAQEAHIAVHRVLALLLELELRGLVSQLPGKYFITEI
jgi:DNA processing protein